MARSIDDLYLFYQYITKKERGVWTTPAQFTQNLDAGQMDAFSEWFKLYGETQQVHDALKPFRIYQSFTSDADGFVTFPSDYLHLLGQPFTLTGSTVNRIGFVNEDELPFALTSQGRPVTTEYPIAVDSADGFSIYPQTQQVGAYFYLRRPLAPVYGYTQNGRQIIYNPGTSIQLEFLDSYVNNIIAKALAYVSIYMNEQGIYQYAEMYNQETTTRLITTTIQ